jgi:adenine-specific DNA-methyltransferase
MRTVAADALSVVGVERKARGAYFTPPAIADFLTTWAITDPSARVLDPTSGDGVFLEAAGRRLRALGSAPTRSADQIHGAELHGVSIQEAGLRLSQAGLAANLIEADFFTLSPPRRPQQQYDAVVGNPPFVRYQQHAGEARRRSALAALQQGVRLSGLASSWAALLVHAGAFLKPTGRLAMVLPAELLTVHYAEPVRRWLRERFETVRLVLFERLQFTDATENVVLLLADGAGGTDSFTLRYVHDAEELESAGLEERVYTPSYEGKWTVLLLSNHERQLFRRVARDHFVGLGEYGSPELGTVTGSNAYFTLTEKTRSHFGLTERQVQRISPPGTKHLPGLTFTTDDWEALREADEQVWILHPSPSDASPSLQRYLAVGLERRVDEAYKCQARSPWWRPPLVTPPDLFFTYMSHRYPRLITNRAHVSFVNSMHGVRLRDGAPNIAREALPLLALNSLTMLGAELYGRSYGGGVLKMEPREASRLPVPAPEHLITAWAFLRRDRAKLDRRLRQGTWASVVARVDDVLLRSVMGLTDDDVDSLHAAAVALRARRTRTA